MSKKHFSQETKWRMRYVGCCIILLKLCILCTMLIAAHCNRKINLFKEVWFEHTKVKNSTPHCHFGIMEWSLVRFLRLSTLSLLGTMSYQLSMQCTLHCYRWPAMFNKLVNSKSMKLSWTNHETSSATPFPNKILLLESIYLYFPPSSQLLYLCFCPVGPSLL